MSMDDKKKGQPKVINTGKIFVYFGDFFKGFKKFWWVIIVCAIILGGFNFVQAKRSYVPLYTSKATFTVSTQQNISSVNGISAYSFFYDSSTVNQLVKTFPYIMSSIELLPYISANQCHECKRNAQPHRHDRGVQFVSGEES